MLRFLAATFFVVALGACALSGSSRQRAEVRAAFFSELRQIAGVSALECGTFLIGQNNASGIALVLV